MKKQEINSIDFIEKIKLHSEYIRALFLNPPNILNFTEFFFEYVQKQKFYVNWHHILISKKLNEILNGTHISNNLMLNIPPRHTKTELAVINFTALGFAINPESQFMHLSSSDSLVTRNATIIRNIIENEYYSSIFHNVKLVNNSKASIVTRNGGIFYTAPFLGQITGFGCGKLGNNKFSGAMIIDDPIKTQDALSKTIREKVNFTWANTLISRKNDINTPVIVVAQRVHKDDFCGFLLEKEGKVDEGGKWDLVQIPAIIEENGVERALWEYRISLDELKKQKELDSWVFGTQYMQKPTPVEGLLFNKEETKYYEELPNNPDYIHIQVDPSDEGNDKTASIIYYVKNGIVFVSDDIVYTSDCSELTIPRILGQIKKSKASTCCIESNSAWSLFRKSIKIKSIEENISTQIISLNSNSNKEIRIINHAPSIINKFFYSKSKNKEYIKYLSDKHDYIKMVKNQDDDGVDTDAAAAAFFKKNGIIETF